MESTLVRRALLMMSSKQPSQRNLCLLEENKLIKRTKVLFVVNFPLVLGSGHFGWFSLFYFCFSMPEDLLFEEFKSDQGYYVILFKIKLLFCTLLLLGLSLICF